MIAADMYAQGVIDVHSHIITPEFLSSLKDEGRLMDEGFPLPEYDAEAHLKWDGSGRCSDIRIDVGSSTADICKGSTQH